MSRLTAVIACAVTLAAIAAPAAGARPAVDPPAVNSAAVTQSATAAPSSVAADSGGLEWSSAAIGAAGAAELLVIGAGATSLVRRHHRVGVIR